MMKRMILCLMLALALLCGGALAEEAVDYVPGSIAGAMFSEAFDAGKVITGDVRLSFYGEIDAPDLDEEEKANLAALMTAADNAALTFGAGRLEDGLHIELGGVYAPQDANRQAAVSAALDVTANGLALESSLIEGERVSVRWETLLALCGMGEEEIARIMALRGQTPEEILAALTDAVAPYAEEALRLLTPYAQTLAAFAAALPMEMEEDLPQTDYFPAAAQELCIVVTEQAVGELMTALADQLEQDAELSPVIDLLIAMQEEGALPFASTAELCAAMRAAAAEWTDEDYPLFIYVGMDAQGDPIYLSLCVEMEDGTAGIVNLIAYPTDDEESFAVLLEAGVLDEDSSFIDGMTFYVESLHEDGGVSGTITFDLYADGEPIASFASESTGKPAAMGGGLPGYIVQDSTAFSALGLVNQVSSAQIIYEMTAEGGERFTGSGSTESYQYGEQSSSSYTQEMIFLPGEDGPTAQLLVVQRLDGIACDAIALDIALKTRPHDPAASDALALTELETVSSEDMNALISRASLRAQEELGTLLELLPPEVVQALTPQELPADAIE